MGTYINEYMHMYVYIICMYICIHIDMERCVKLKILFFVIHTSFSCEVHSLQFTSFFKQTFVDSLRHNYIKVGKTTLIVVENEFQLVKVNVLRLSVYN